MNAVVPGAIDGEILRPGETVSVTAAMQPLTNERTLFSVPSGSSLMEIVEMAALAGGVSRLSRGARVSIDGHVIPQENWHRVRVKAGRNVVVRAVAGKGIGNILKSIFSLALAVFASFIVGPAGLGIAGLFGGGALGAIASSAAIGAIMLGGNLLLNALFPPSSTKAIEDTPSYSISAQKNGTSKWGPIPVVLGKVRVHPKYAAQPYTEFVGDEQYLRMLFVWAYGPIKIEDLRLGDTSIDHYDDVEIETFEGYSDDGQQTIYPSEVLQNDLNIVVSKDDGPFVQSSAEDASEVAVDLVAPQGIVKIDGKGNKNAFSVAIKVEMRATGSADDWTDKGTVTLKGKTNSPIRKTERYKTGGGQWDLRLTRLTKDYDPGEGGVYSEVHWTAIKTFRTSPPIEFSKPLAITAIRIRATKQLNGTIDNLNGLVTSVAESFDGDQWTAAQETSNPGDLFRFVLQANSNARAQPDTRLDLTTIEAFADRCRDKGFAFNMYRDFTASVRDTLKDIAAAGRGVPTFRDGRWSVAWEDDSAPIVQHFTPRNSRDFAWTQTYKVFPHGLRCKFVNERKDYVEDEMLVFDEGYDKVNATLFEQAEFPGVTDPDQIYKAGKYRIADAKLRPAIYKLTVDFEHLVAQRSDRVVLAYDVIETGLASGRVQAVAGQTVTIDEPAVMEAGTDYAIRFRLKDGSSAVRSVVNDPGSHTGITIVGTAPEAGNLYSFGIKGQETGTFRVLRIKPGEDLSAEIDLVDDGADVEAADADTDIPGTTVPLPTDLAAYAPRNVRVKSSFVITGTTRKRITSVYWSQPAGLAIDGLQLVATEDDGEEIRRTLPASQLSDTFEGLSDGQWTFKVRALVAGWATPFSASAPLTIDIANDRPDDVAGFRINVLGDMTTLSWTPDTAVNHDHYVLRYSPAGSGANWSSSALQLPHIDATSAQIPTRPGSYLIKAVTAQGKESRNAAIIETTVGASAINAVETFVEEPAWAGSKDGVFAFDGELRLKSLDTLADWPSLSAVHTLAYGVNGVQSNGTYTSPTTIDLGAIYTSRVTPHLQVRGANLANVMANWPVLAELGLLDNTSVTDWSATIEMRTTSDDPSADPTWSDWAEALTGDVTARALQMRVVLTSGKPNITPIVTKAELTVDMPDRVIGQNDLDVPTDGLRIDFEPAYKALKGLSISAQGLETGDYYLITAKDRTGFTIIFKDSADTAVERSFDYVATGYGRRAT